MKWKVKYLYKGLKHQLPVKRFFRNFFITGNAWGMFSINSHINQKTGLGKIGYNSLKTALKSADNMGEKHNKHFSTYYCIFCGKYHIGKNNDNK